MSLHQLARQVVVHPVLLLPVRRNEAPNTEGTRRGRTVEEARARRGAELGSKLVVEPVKNRCTFDLNHDNVHNHENAGPNAIYFSLCMLYTCFVFDT